MRKKPKILPMSSPCPSPPGPTSTDVWVACLCAQWCGTCRDYRSTFETLAQPWPHVWVDIEDQADALGDADVDNFPTLLVGRGERALFYGPILPHPDHLLRLMQWASAGSDADARANATAESAVLQALSQRLRALLPAR
jgi:thioredoxin 1